MDSLDFSKGADGATVGTEGSISPEYTEHLIGVLRAYNEKHDAAGNSIQAVGETHAPSPQGLVPHEYDFAWNSRVSNSSCTLEEMPLNDNPQPAEDMSAGNSTNNNNAADPFGNLLPALDDFEARGYDLNGAAPPAEIVGAGNSTSNNTLEHINELQSEVPMGMRAGASANIMLPVGQFANPDYAEFAAPSRAIPQRFGYMGAGISANTVVFAPQDNFFPPTLNGAMQPAWEMAPDNGASAGNAQEMMPPLLGHRLALQFWEAQAAPQNVATPPQPPAANLNLPRGLQGPAHRSVAARRHRQAPVAPYPAGPAPAPATQQADPAQEAPHEFTRRGVPNRDPARKGNKQGAVPGWQRAHKHHQRCHEVLATGDCEQGCLLRNEWPSTYEKWSRQRFSVEWPAVGPHTPARREIVSGLYLEIDAHDFKVIGEVDPYTLDIDKASKKVYRVDAARHVS